jgi:hypothetical protein
LGFYEWKTQKKEFRGLIFRGFCLLQFFVLFCFICLFVVYEEVWMLDFLDVSKLYESFENVMFLLVLEVLVSLVGGEVIEP